MARRKHKAERRQHCNVKTLLAHALPPALLVNILLWAVLYAFVSWHPAGTLALAKFFLGLASLSLIPLAGMFVGFHCYRENRDLRTCTVSGALYGFLFAVICLGGYYVYYGGSLGANAIGGLAVMLFVGGVMGLFGGFTASYRARCKDCSILPV